MDLLDLLVIQARLLMDPQVRYPLYQEVEENGHVEDRNLEAGRVRSKESRENIEKLADKDFLVA